MPVEQRFQPRGRTFAWVATLLGAALIADAVWCIVDAQLWAAVVVGGVGLERWVFAATDYWHRRIWPYRLAAVRLDVSGLIFEERNPYAGDTRTTVLPAGLVLDARVQREPERGDESPWSVRLFTILGTLVWGEYDDEKAADAVADELRAVLDAREPADLTPPRATGTLDIIGAQRGVMWGTRPLVPISIAARALLLLATIVAVPNLVGGTASLLLWLLTGLTVALLAFPFMGAVAILMRRGPLIGFGVTAQHGELRAWERSTVSHVVPVTAVGHIGFGELRISGEPLAMQLVAHTQKGTPVEAIVPRSAVANLAQQACRLVAELHDPELPTTPEWAVRLPGGIAEAIEAVSWAQRFLAEAQDEIEDPLADLAAPDAAAID